MYWMNVERHIIDNYRCFNFLALYYWDHTQGEEDKYRVRICVSTIFFFYRNARSAELAYVSYER